MAKIKTFAGASFLCERNEGACDDAASHPLYVDAPLQWNPAPRQASKHPEYTHVKGSMAWGQFSLQGRLEPWEKEELGPCAFIEARRGPSLSVGESPEYPKGHWKRGRY